MAKIKLSRRNKRMLVSLLAIGPLVLVVSIGANVIAPDNVISRRGSNTLKTERGERFIAPNSKKELKFSETDRYLIKEMCQIPGVESVHIRQVFNGEYAPVAGCNRKKSEAFALSSQSALIECIQQGKSFTCPVVPNVDQFASVEVILRDDANLPLIEGRVKTLEISLIETNSTQGS